MVPEIELPKSRRGRLIALASSLREKGLKLAAAESCTGGLLAGAVTSVAGSSEFFNGCVVAYANEVKESLLGVSLKTLESSGAVSARTAKEMAEGALVRLNAGIAVSVTGIAGPGGGTAKKPVGTVYIAVAFNGRCAAKKFLFTGSRVAIRKKTVDAALDELLKALGRQRGA